MSRKIYLSAMLCISTLFSGKVNAQCPTGRFDSYVFSSFDKSTVTYSTPYSQMMDIYQPTGDTMTARPLIILAHGGSFVGGSRNSDTTVDQMCRNFAKRGYVTASIDYRLGNIFNMITDSAYAIDVVIKAISDGKAAVRYFYKDAATTNTYKIDTNHIYFGGNSAGAVLYMHAGYLTDTNEAPDYIKTALAANGGIEGNSGNAGYSSKAKAVINLAGALNSASFVSTGDLPSVNAQGDNDVTVPYVCAYPLSGSVHVNLCGLGILEPAYVAKGIYHMSKVFVGDTHVPWDGDAAKFATVDSLVTTFLYTLNCPANVASVSNANVINEVTLYPNPATSVVNIRSSETLNDVVICDQTGRIVATYKDLSTKSYELNTASLSTGVYFVKIRFANESVAPMIKSVVIE